MLDENEHMLFVKLSISFCSILNEPVRQIGSISSVICRLSPFYAVFTVYTVSKLFVNVWPKL